MPVAWQVPFTQLLLVQSALTTHVLPFAHAEQVPPPQSTSVSFPFLMPSAQLAQSIASMNAGPVTPPVVLISTPTSLSNVGNGASTVVVSVFHAPLTGVTQWFGPEWKTQFWSL